MRLCEPKLGEIPVLTKNFNPMSNYKVTRPFLNSNLIVDQLNASVLPMTFESTEGVQKADLYTSPNSADKLVGHGSCRPVNATLVGTFEIDFGVARFVFLSPEDQYESSWASQPVDSEIYTVAEITEMAIGSEPDHIWWTAKEIEGWKDFYRVYPMK